MLKIIKSKKKILSKLTITIFGIIIFILIIINFGTKVYALSKYGSRSEEVKQIQTKLKRWGYYNGNVDGVYGSDTLEAVKKFQKKNGLTADGIAGKSTLEALGIETGNSSSSSNSGYSNNSSDVNLLAKLIYGEARGEPYTGQVAVGAVVMNRVKSNSFPNTISGVIYQSGSFDVVADGQINMSPNETAKKAAQDVYNGWDPSNGAIYYFNPNTATNKWIWSRTVTVVIGSHRFCK